MQMYNCQMQRYQLVGEDYEMDLHNKYCMRKWQICNTNKESEREMRKLIVLLCLMTTPTFANDVDYNNKMIKECLEVWGMDYSWTSG